MVSGDRNILYLLIHICFVSTVLTTVIYIFYRFIAAMKVMKSVFFKKKGNPMIEKAIKKGHVIDASLISQSRTGIDNTENDVVSTYRYEWEGKVYEKSFSSSNYGTEARIKLYFDKDPKYATTEDHFLGKDFHLFKIFFTILVVDLILNLIIYH